MLHDLPLPSQRQAQHIYATGFLVIITLGTFTAIVACLAALWAVVELATLLLQSIIECLTTIGQLYTTSDPLIKFCLICAIGAVLYLLARRLIRRETR